VLMLLTIIVNDSVYGIEKPWNAFRLASTSVSKEFGMDVRLFLMGDSVCSAKKGQRTPEGYYNMEKMLGTLIKRGVEVRVCGACIDTRGLLVEELVDGVLRGSMNILATWIKESDKVLSF
jgi:uncharacterized protein involved in oxidation of intracellular sulfur